MRAAALLNEITAVLESDELVLEAREAAGAIRSNGAVSGVRALLAASPEAPSGSSPAAVSGS